MKSKFYAVLRGRRTGIFRQWGGLGGAEAQVKGFTGARFKSFATLQEAQNWLTQGGPAPQKAGQDKAPSKQLQHAEISGDPIIYTDGGCKGNPGPGGYGIVIIENGERRELSGGFRKTTNNRMELTACIVALEQAKGAAPVLYTDSLYVVKGIREGWAAKWRAAGWMRTKDQMAENTDLWARLLALHEKRPVRFEWVRGHAGTPENERCDQLAVAATARPNLPPDDVYERK